MTNVITISKGEAQLLIETYQNRIEQLIPLTYGDVGNKQEDHIGELIQTLQEKIDELRQITK